MRQIGSITFIPENMPRFIGTKTLKAIGMSRADYCMYRGWSLPAGENGADMGYLVEYTDGGKPNDSRHEGYISWSQKEQFDNAYRHRPLVDGMAPHQQRVVDEQADLNEKLIKLEAFTDTPLFASLPEAERGRLMAQHGAMFAYFTILAERIAAF